MMDRWLIQVACTNGRLDPAKTYIVGVVLGMILGGLFSTVLLSQMAQ